MTMTGATAGANWEPTASNTAGNGDRARLDFPVPGHRQGGTTDPDAMTRKTERIDDKPVNLKVLAEYLDLSPATISLVMNNAPGAKSIALATRERVLAAAGRQRSRRADHLDGCAVDRPGRPLRRACLAGRHAAADEPDGQGDRPESVALQADDPAFLRASHDQRRAAFCILPGREGQVSRDPQRCRRAGLRQGDRGISRVSEPGRGRRGD